MKKQEGFQGQKAIVIPRSVVTQKCVKNDIISTLYITDIGYYPKAKNHYRERQYGADQHILIYCHKGSGRVTIKTTEHLLKADSFIIIPIKTTHRYEADEKDPWTIYWLHFKGTIANSILSLLQKQTGGHKGDIRNNEQILSLFNEMYLQLEKGYGTDNLIYTNMCLWHFLTAFIYNGKFTVSAQVDTKDPTDTAINFLRTRVGQALSLNEIAKQVNLSPSHFSFIFKKKTGFSPIEYFNHLKIQKACQYLLFTPLRIKEIAREVGLDDPYYFSRLFTKIMGLPPYEYRVKKLH